MNEEDVEALGAVADYNALLGNPIMPAMRGGDGVVNAMAGGVMAADMAKDLDELKFMTNNPLTAQLAENPTDAQLVKNYRLAEIQR